MVGKERQGPSWILELINFSGILLHEISNHRDSEQSPFQHKYSHTHVRFQFILFRHEPIISFPLQTLCQRLRVWSKEDFLLSYCYKKQQNKKFRNLNLKVLTFWCSGVVILKFFKKVDKHIKRNSHSWSNQKHTIILFLSQCNLENLVRFAATCSMYSRRDSPALKMEATCSSKTSVPTTTTRHQIPEDDLLHRKPYLYILFSLLTTCFGPSWPSSGVSSYARTVKLHWLSFSQFSCALMFIILVLLSTKLCCSLILLIFIKIALFKIFVLKSHP
jgi:hypothetical protein